MQFKILNISFINNKKLTIHGYGASTKGNVLLQFYDIVNKDVNYIADRNPLKYNLFTPVFQHAGHVQWYPIF